MNNNEDLTTYIITFTNGKVKKVTVPSSWKVTFGPLLPGGRSGVQRPALRMYENKDKQRAVFNDVESFRDAAIPVEEKITRTQEQVLSKAGPDGMKDVVVGAVMTEWINPDKPVAPKKEFLKLDKIDYFDDDEDGVL